MDQSGPDSVAFGNAAASVCERGFAQYSLNIRAALLSEPDVMRETSHALRIHALAFVKSDTYRAANQHKAQRGTEL